MQETPVQFLCWGRSPGEEEGYPLQFSGLENSMDCTAHGVTKSQHTCMTFTLLVNSVQLRFNSRMKTNNLFIPTIYVSYFLLDYAFYMPPWMKIFFFFFKLCSNTGYTQVALVVNNLPANAGDLQRPGFDPWVGKIPCRRKWQPTPVYLPGEPSGQRNLVCYNPWGCKRWDMTAWIIYPWRDPSNSNYSFTSTNYCWLVYTHTHTHNHKTATNHPAWVKSHSSILRVRSIIFWYPDSRERNNEEIDSCCLIITVTLLHNYHPTTLVSLS